MRYKPAPVRIDSTVVLQAANSLAITPKGSEGNSYDWTGHNSS